MRFRFSIFVLLVAICFFISPYKSIGKVNLAQYGLETSIDLKHIETKVQQQMDSIYGASLFVKEEVPQYGKEKPKLSTNKTADFYILLGLVLFLGIIRFIDPKYLLELWVAYFNTGYSGKSLREKIEHSNVSNALMNVFFVMCFGAYLYYVIKLVTHENPSTLKTPFLFLLIIAGVVIVYVVKFIVVRFTGWAFDIKGVTDTYLFNVFLVNKLLAIGLLPFLIIMAFHNEVWASIALILSVVFIIILYISRYVKSWQVLGSFFQYSKFHFFTYLCASEIMPLAILMKFLISKWL